MAEAHREGEHMQAACKETTCTGDGGGGRWEFTSEYPSSEGCNKIESLMLDILGERMTK